MKLNRGRKAVLILAALPMVVVGAVGAVATYTNMDNVLHRSTSALGLVAAGEGATLICALVALAVTLMGQHTPVTVRAGMWLVPLAASGVGIALAPSSGEAVVMGFTPLAMTAAGEGTAFIARRMVAYTTGVDLEQQRRSGLMVWHAHRSVNGSGPGRWISRTAVARLTKWFAATDAQMNVQLGSIQRFRISEGADANLAAVLAPGKAGPQAAVSSPAAPVRQLTPGRAAEAVQGPQNASGTAMPQWARDGLRRHEAAEAETLGSLSADLRRMSDADRAAAESLADGIEDALADAAAEAEAIVVADPAVKLLTTAEVARLKGVAPGTVRSWKHRGILKAVMVEGHPMFHPVDVARLD